MIELDILSKRYSTLPSDILKLDLESYQFNLLVADVAIDEEYRVEKKARQKAERIAQKNKSRKR